MCEAIRIYLSRFLLQGKPGRPKAPRPEPTWGERELDPPACWVQAGDSRREQGRIRPEATLQRGQGTAQYYARNRGQRRRQGALPNLHFPGTAGRDRKSVV